MTLYIICDDFIIMCLEINGNGMWEKPDHHLVREHLIYIKDWTVVTLTNISV